MDVKLTRAKGNKMNRRRFFGAVAGLSGLAIFPRKSESAQSDGLSHEQMAQAILNYPYPVYLSGDARSFGKSRTYHYATARRSDRIVGEWKDEEFGDQIGRRHVVTSINGCVVETRFYDYDRLIIERVFDISNPLLKVIRLLSTPSRYFARHAEKWVEL